MNIIDQHGFTELERLAIKKSGVENWYPWLFERATDGVICTGAVCPLITRGVNKGRPNFRKRDMLTISKVFVSDAT